MGGGIDLSQLQTVVQRCEKEFNQFQVFVETGTFLGETTMRMASVFAKVYTIEVSEPLYSRMHGTLSKYPNIVPILGDSKVVLKSLVKEIDPQSPVIYFLDAHFSSGITSKADKDVPLLEELEAIGSRGNPTDIVVIDDFRLFGTRQNEDWGDITVTNVLKAITGGDTSKKPKWFVDNDQLVIYW